MSEPSAETKGTAPDQEPSNTGPRRNLFYRSWKYAYRKLPSAIPDPNRREILRQVRQRDEEDNAKTEPPEDELIDLRCVWAVEFYTPSQISKLLRKFEELGWNTDDPAAAQDNPSIWIRQFRESAHGGGWFNLGPIHRPDDRRFYRHGRSAPLPTDVDYALAAMYSLTSSITCIVVGFILNETYSRRFDQALRRKRQTFLEPLPGGGYRLPGPPSQKEADVKAIRADIRAVAADWFRTYLPGLFAGGIMVGEFPTCEFIGLPHRSGPPVKLESGGCGRPAGLTGA